MQFSSPLTMHFIMWRSQDGKRVCAYFFSSFQSLFTHDDDERRKSKQGEGEKKNWLNISGAGKSLEHNIIP